MAFDKNDPADMEIVQGMIDEAVSGLKANQTKLQSELRKAKAKGEIDPADVERLETELETVKGQLTEANKAAKTAATRADTAEKALGTEQAHTQKLLVDQGLTAALTAEGVTSPVMLKAASAMIRAGHQIDIAVDGEIRAAKVGDKGLGDFVKAWAQGDEGKAFVTAPAHGGGGGIGGGKLQAVNPFVKGPNFSLTEQGKIYNENPTLAAQMQAQAAAPAQT